MTTSAYPRLRRALLTIAICLPALLGPPAGRAALAQTDEGSDAGSDTGPATEFPQPDPNNWLYDIVAGPDEAMWYEGSFAIGRVALDGTVTSTFPLPDAQSSVFGVKPAGITVGPDKNLWATMALLAPNGGVEVGGRIVRLSPSGDLQAFSPATPSHVPGNVTVGPDGALWFTESLGTPGAQRGFIGRITTSGAVSEFPLPAGHNAIRGIVAGPDGALWFPEGQSDLRGLTSPTDSRIGRMDPKGAVREFPLPAPGASTGGAITVGPDGALWFTEGDARSAVTRIGRITTAGATSDFPLPNPIMDSGKDEIRSGPDGALWFTYGDNTSGPSAISRITTSGDVIDYPLADGVYPWDFAFGPDGALWLAEGPILTADPIGPSKIGHLQVSAPVLLP